MRFMGEVMSMLVKEVRHASQYFGFLRSVEEVKIDMSVTA